MLKVITHSHTVFSSDGFITPDKMRKYAAMNGIDCICITDHDTMDGVSEFSRSVGIRIIAGEEMATGEGDLIGLFLKQGIDAGLGLEETATSIKQQGGLVYLPHPFDEFRKSAVKRPAAEKIKHLIDIVEVFNSRTFNPKYNEMAREFADTNGITVSVGSDAHHPLEYANAHVLMEDFDGPASFLDSLKRATLSAKKCPFLLRAYLKGLKVLTGKD